MKQNTHIGHVEIAVRACAGENTVGLQLMRWLYSLVIKIALHAFLLCFQ